MNYRRVSYSICLFVSLLWIVGCQAAPREQFTLLADAGVSGTAAPDRDVQEEYRGVGHEDPHQPVLCGDGAGARRLEAESDLQLIVKTGAQETSIEQQIAIIYDLIQEGVDAIVIAPADSLELVPALQAAQESGIVIVNVDNPLDPILMETMGVVDVPLVTVDNAAGAYLAAHYLAEQVTGPAKTVILEGIRGAQNAEDRKQGALRAFAEFPNIEVVAMETANWKIDEARTVIASIFEAIPDIRLVFAANDMMALGVLQYLEESGRTEVLVAGYDALDEAKMAILAGTLQATVNQQADLQGYTAVRYADDLLHGRPVPAMTLVDVRLVTQSNLPAP